MNECHFIGNLVADPEVRMFANGSKKVKVRLAISRYFKKSDGSKGKKTVFADFEAWDSGGETIANYLKKGDALVVTNASLEQDEWEHEGQKRTKLYFRINQFQFAPGGKKDAEDGVGGESKSQSKKPARRKEPQPEPQPEPEYEPAGAANDDGDIPF
jgi:single-strand DNA-binding protein